MHNKQSIPTNVLHELFLETNKYDKRFWADQTTQWVLQPSMIDHASRYLPFLINALRYLLQTLKVSSPATEYRITSAAFESVQRNVWRSNIAEATRSSSNL